MAKNFLDETGVGTLWKKIKSVFATKTEVKNDHYTKLEVDRIQQGNVNALNNKLGKVNPTLENTNLRIVDGMVTGELNLRPEFHAIRLGQTGRDYCEFTEWGGTFRFFQCDSNIGVPGNKLAEINPNGVYYKESKLATEEQVNNAISTANSANTIAQQAMSYKQDKLQSGYNIKTINGQNILGEGDLTIKTSSSVEPKLIWSGKSQYPSIKFEGNRFFLVYYTIPTQTSSEFYQLVYIKSDYTITNAVANLGSSAAMFVEFSHDRTYISANIQSLLRDKQGTVSLGYTPDEIYITAIYQLT